MHTPSFIFCAIIKLMKKKFSLKHKIKFFLFIFTILKSIFLVHRFFKKHPKFKKKIESIIKKNKRFNSFFKHLQSFFIPGQDNDHTPRALRPRALTSYALIIILTKLFISSYLFLVFPTVLSAFTTIENEILTLVNESRAQAQVVPLKIDLELGRAAQAKADDMIANDYFAHFGSDGKSPWDWIDYKKYPYSIAGENLGKDFVTASSVHRALLVSSTHKKNILNPGYRDLGIGIAVGQINNRDTMVLVQMFGARAPAISILSKLKTPEDVRINVRTVETELFGESAPVILAKADSRVLAQNFRQIQAQNIETATTQQTTRDWLQTLLRYSDFFMFILLGFLVLALLLNIFIQIRVQKPRVILNTLLVIGVILVFMFTNFHYLEGIARVVSIK